MAIKDVRVFESLSNDVKLKHHYIHEIVKDVRLSNLFGNNDKIEYHPKFKVVKDTRLLNSFGNYIKIEYFFVSIVVKYFKSFINILPIMPNLSTILYVRLYKI